MMQANPTQIDQRTFSLRPNTSQWSSQPDGNGGFKLTYKPKSVSDNFLARLDAADGGPFRFLQTLERVCESLSLAGLGNQFSSAAKIFNSGWTATIYPRLPGAFQSAKEAVGELTAKSSTPGFFCRKCVNALHETMTFFSSVGYAAAPLLFLSEKTSQAGSSALRGSKVMTLVGDVCELEKSGEDAIRAHSLASRAKQLNVSSDLINTLKQTETLHVLKTMKAICSVAGFVLGLGLAAAGVATLPAFVILASSISLVGTFLATGASLYKEGMQYKPVDFFDAKQVQYIAKTA